MYDGLKEKKKKATNERIPQTRLYNFDRTEPHFYIVKLGFTGGIHDYSFFC